jgi:hypothetical protein
MDVNIAGSDVVQRRRERDKARWHAMSQEKKDEKNKKRREAYKRKKEQQLCIETINGCIVEILVNKNIDITIHVSHMCYVSIGRWTGCIKQGKYGS